MAETTINTYDIPTVSRSGDRFDTEYRRSPMWDTEKEDFVRDGAYAIAQADGHEGFKTWCAKMCATERFQCLSYQGCIGDQLGVEMDALRYQSDHATIESMMKRTITEALMANPRTISVRDFKFTWGEDSITGTCTVQALEMDDFTLDF